MNNQMQGGMAEATRLMREGRLAEATAVIQSTLGGPLGGAFGPTASPDGPGGPTEASSYIVDEAPQPMAPPRTSPTEHTLRPAPKPPRGFRRMPRSPGGLPGATPQPAEGVPAPEAVPAGGRFVERSYTNRAGTRAYKLYIPSGYVGQATPLVVMLHGCTQNPDDFAAGTRMNALAEEHTFLVAYPAQAQNNNMQKCWNWFKDADQQRERGEPSIIAGITREVVAEMVSTRAGCTWPGCRPAGRWPPSWERPTLTCTLRWASTPAWPPAPPTTSSLRSPRCKTANRLGRSPSWPPPT